jgi:chitodextrinase
LLLSIVFGSITASGQEISIRDRIPPTAPTNLVVTGMTPHSVSLAWGPSKDNSGSFTYVICCAGGSVTVSQNVTSHTIQGLNSGATYTLRVNAKDAAGNVSRPSNSVTVTLPQDVSAPTKPIVTVVNIGPTHVSLTWSSTDNGPIWYYISLDGQVIFTLNSKSGTITPLEQSTTYTITVQALDAEGNFSPVSDPVIVTTEPPPPNDHMPPTAPTNLTVEGGVGDVVVQWTASVDNVAPQAFIRYDVYINGELSAVAVGKTSAIIHLDLGVNVITVIATDTADNASEPVSITVTV